MRRLSFSVLMLLSLRFCGAPQMATAEEIQTWNPFVADLGDALRANDPRVVIIDGDFGASLLMLHEPGAGSIRDMRRDGLPLGTGHRWSDDLWTLSLAGLDGNPRISNSADGSAGHLQLRSVQGDTTGSRMISEWFKGGDESYLRRISFHTPQAPWTLGFDFDERILHDFESRDAVLADFPPFPRPDDDPRLWPSQAGESKARTARMSLVHRSDDGSSLAIVHTRARKHKQALPVFDQDRHEYWIDRTHIRWSGAAAGGTLHVGAAMNGVDMVSRQRDAAENRTIETVRQLAQMNWLAADSLWNLGMEASSLRLHDDALDTDWAGDDGIPRDRSLQEGDVKLTRHWDKSGLQAQLAAGVGIRRGIGSWPELGLQVDHISSRLHFELSQDGRAPASEELWTPWTTASPAATVRTLPNENLERERVLRAALSWSGSWAGLDYQLASSVRRLRDGIGWALVDDDPSFGFRGRWHNGLEIDGWTAGLHVEHRRHFAGELRLEGRMDIRGWTAEGGDRDLLAVYLPPEHSGAVAAWWEHEWFSGDGTLELGWQSEFRAAMSDPWLPDGFVTLPSMTMHHAMIMFNLTGADLGVSLRNVMNSQVRLSSGAMSRGREMRWRLQWTLWH